MGRRKQSSQEQREAPPLGPRVQWSLQRTQPSHHLTTIPACKALGRIRGRTTLLTPASPGDCERDEDSCLGQVCSAALGKWQSSDSRSTSCRAEICKNILCEMSVGDDAEECVCEGPPRAGPGVGGSLGGRPAPNRLHAAASSEIRGAENRAIVRSSRAQRFCKLGGRIVTHTWHF